MESPNQPTPNQSLTVWQVVLRKPFEEIKAFGEWLREQTIGFMICQHEADQEITTTHCHILLEGLKVGTEGLRKQIKKVCPGRGQYAIMEKTQKTREDYDRDKLAIYCIKGSVANCKLASYDEVQQAIWATKWVDRSEPLSKEEKDKTIWDVIMKAHGMCHKEWKYGSHNELNLQAEPSKENWFILMRELNLAKIKTSRNELERAWVTLLRQDPRNQEDLYNSIMSNVFRNNI